MKREDECWGQRRYFKTKWFIFLTSLTNMIYTENNSLDLINTVLYSVVAFTAIVPEHGVKLLCHFVTLIAFWYLAWLTLSCFLSRLWPQGDSTLPSAPSLGCLSRRTNRWKRHHLHPPTDWAERTPLIWRRVSVLREPMQTSMSNQKRMETVGDSPQQWALCLVSLFIAPC